MISENTLSEESKNELDKIRGIEKTGDGENFIYRANEYTYSFKDFQTISFFVRDIYNGTITLKEADKDQSDLLVEVFNFKKNIKPQNPEKNQ